MVEDERHFPDDWPDGCPPGDAEDAVGTVYACARHNPLLADDFRSAHERGVFRGRDECQRRGLSVCREQDDARALCERFPTRFRHICTAELDAGHGKLKPTPARLLASHCTLWTYRDVELHNACKVIE